MNGRVIEAADGQVVKDLVVSNRLGIHARPASLFVRIANQFQSEIHVEKDGERVNGKSILGLMLLAAGPGSRIRLHANGSDAARAVTELEALVRNKFGEE